MNEEIKFRYIIKHKGKIKTIYATLDEIEQGKMDDYLMQKSAKFRGEDKLLARDRYIGLKDKNRKEIYDGDIVKRDVYDDFVFVKWEDPVWDSDTGASGYKLVKTDSDRYEIIGNITENPELLKTTK